MRKSAAIGGAVLLLACVGDDVSSTLDASTDTAVDSPSDATADAISLDGGTDASSCDVAIGVGPLTSCVESNGACIFHDGGFDCTTQYSTCQSETGYFEYCTTRADCAFYGDAAVCCFGGGTTVDETTCPTTIHLTYGSAGCTTGFPCAASVPYELCSTNSDCVVGTCVPFVYGGYPSLAGMARGYCH